MSTYEISVVKALCRGERKHTVVYYLVEASTEVQASSNLREYLQDRIERYEHISDPRKVGDIHAVTYSSCTPEELLKRQGKPLPEKKPKPAPKLSNRPLGETQRSILESVRNHGGWPGNGWIWSTESATLRLLDGLAQRCLLDRIVHKDRRLPEFKINALGLKTLESTGTLKRA